MTLRSTVIYKLAPSIRELWNYMTKLRTRILHKLEVIIMLDTLLMTDVTAEGSKSKLSHIGCTSVVEKKSFVRYVDVSYLNAGFWKM
jgi:hypothetical protein